MLLQVLSNPSPFPIPDIRYFAYSLSSADDDVVTRPEYQESADVSMPAGPAPEAKGAWGALAALQIRHYRKGVFL